jgi:hypothetical protein
MYPLPRAIGGRPTAIAALLIMLPAAALPRPAAAHALVVGSDPPQGAMLGAAPQRVVIRFNSRIDPARSRLSLVAAEDRGVAPVHLTIAEAEDRTMLAATLPPLAPGGWRLRWQVLAVDGHITRGDIGFVIRPPGTGG